MPGGVSGPACPFLKATQGSQGVIGGPGQGLRVEWVELEQQRKERSVLGSCQLPTRKQLFLKFCSAQHGA